MLCQCTNQLINSLRSVHFNRKTSLMRSLHFIIILFFGIANIGGQFSIPSCFAACHRNQRHLISRHGFLLFTNCVGTLFSRHVLGTLTVAHRGFLTRSNNCPSHDAKNGRIILADSLFSFDSCLLIFYNCIRHTQVRPPN
uniref:Uncharacterized protein n=1 Tax=Oryza rufipogon TaxID=4529 RepID=A0A0E0PDI9_ORYRU